MKPERITLDSNQKRSPPEEQGANRRVSNVDNISHNQSKTKQFSADIEKKSENVSKSPDSRLKSALEYANKGWPVFPVGDNKRPAVKAWEQKATTDENQIRSWYENLSMNGCNFGFCPGRAGIAVIDLDMNKKGKDGTAVNGRDSLADFCKEQGKTLPETFTVKTPSGGLHYYYKVPRAVRSKNAFLPAVDVKTSGGYVVIPGSTNANGGKYEVSCGIAVADMPQWFLDLYGHQANAEAAKEKVTQPPADITADTPDKIERAIEIISGWEPCDEGVRNDQLYQMMRELLKAGISRKKAAELYEDYGVEKINLAPDSSEVAATIASAYKDMSDFGAESEEHGKNAIKIFDVPPDDESNGEAAGATTDDGSVNKFRLRPSRYFYEKEKQEIHYYIDGFVSDRPGLYLLYAGGGVGKTIAAHQMLASITHEIGFLGRETHRNAGGKKFKGALISLEEPEDDIALRVQRSTPIFQGTEGYKFEDDDYLVMNLFKEKLRLIERGKTELSPGADFRGVVDVLKAEGVNFLMIDNLSRFFPGDENNRNQTTDFGTVMNQLSAELGDIPVWVLAHTNKANVFSGNTGWNGICRERFMMTETAAKDGSTVVTFKNEKANITKKGSVIGRGRWYEYTFAEVKEEDFVEMVGEDTEHIDAIAKRAIEILDDWAEENSGVPMRSTELRSKLKNIATDSKYITKALDNLVKAGRIEKTKTKNGNNDVDAYIRRREE